MLIITIIIIQTYKNEKKNEHIPLIYVWPRHACKDLLWKKHFWTISLTCKLNQVWWTYEHMENAILAYKFDMQGAFSSDTIWKIQHAWRVVEMEKESMKAWIKKRVYMQSLDMRLYLLLCFGLMKISFKRMKPLHFNTTLRGLESGRGF